MLVTSIVSHGGPSLSLSLFDVCLHGERASGRGRLFKGGEKKNKRREGYVADRSRTHEVVAGKYRSELNIGLKGIRVSTDDFIADRSAQTVAYNYSAC